MTKNQVKGILVLVFFLFLILVYIKVTTPEPISVLHSNDPLLDLNHVDSLSLLRLPGIGPKRAHSILQYRRIWNGYRSSSELSHIALIPTDLLDTLQKLVYVKDAIPLQKKKLDNKCYSILINSTLFSKKEAYIIQKYIDTPDSIKKYLTPQSIQKLYRYFELPHSMSHNEEIRNSIQRKYELNQITEEELQSITCLPIWLKKRFLNYRKRLGYFVNIYQLQELYGIKPEHFDCFSKYFYLDTTRLSSLPKISINHADAKTLLRLPYLKKELAFRIIKYREKIGPYDSLPELYRVYGMDSITYQKIMPYLTL